MPKGRKLSGICILAAYNIILIPNYVYTKSVKDATANDFNIRCVHLTPATCDAVLHSDTMFVL